MDKFQVMIRLINRDGIEIETLEGFHDLSSLAEILGHARDDNPYAVRIVVDMALPYN